MHSDDKCKSSQTLMWRRQMTEKKEENVGSANSEEALPVFSAWGQKKRTKSRVELVRSRSATWNVLDCRMVERQPALKWPSLPFEEYWANPILPSLWGLPGWAAGGLRHGNSLPCRRCGAGAGRHPCRCPAWTGWTEIRPGTLHKPWR